MKRSIRPPTQLLAARLPPRAGELSCGWGDNHNRRILSDLVHAAFHCSASRSSWVARMSRAVAWIFPPSVRVSILRLAQLHQVRFLARLGACSPCCFVLGFHRFGSWDRRHIRLRCAVARDYMSHRTFGIASNTTAFVPPCWRGLYLRFNPL